MAGEDSDDYFPKFDFDDEDDNFGFSNIQHPDPYDLGYLPESPNFFEDMHFDQETEVNNNEFRQLLQADEHDTVTLVENAANLNENHFDVHDDVGYVPQEPIFPQQILSDQGRLINAFEFSHHEEHDDDADTLIKDANPSDENHSLGHDVGDFPKNIDYPSQEHIIEEHQVEGNMTDNLGCENDCSRVNRTERWPGWPGQNVFRLLVPAKKVGCIIGPKGEYIRKIIEETKARIKVLHAPSGISERAVLIFGREVPHCTMPPAVEGLLRVHEQLLNDTAYVTSNAVCSIVTITRLLVPDSQGRSLVGMHGFTIKSIQQASGCAIRVLRSGSRPVFALKDDSVVEIRGESARVHKALELVALFLRKYLVDRSIIQVFEDQMQRLDGQVNYNMPPPQTWGPPPPQRVPTLPAVAADGKPDFAPNHQYMSPFHHYGNYYPPATLPPIGNHLHQDPPPAYATNSSMEIQSSSVEPQPSVETKDTQHLQIPELLVQNFVVGATSAEHDHMEGSHSQGDSSYAPSPPSGASDDTLQMMSP